MKERSKGLTKRIEALQRRAHAFHRYAHHPLCDRYGSELVVIGRRARVCRGCTLALGGAALGLAVGAVVPASAWLGASAIASYALAAGATLARVRVSKLVTRAAPALGLVAWLTSSRSSAVALVVALLAASAWLAYRRMGPNRSPCATCPERALPQTCSGYRSMLRAERAFQRAARRLYDNCALTPRLR